MRLCHRHRRKYQYGRRCQEETGTTRLNRRTRVHKPEFG